MNAAGIISIILVCLAFAKTSAQEKTQQYKTKFVPEHITYNGSDNPHECWESVDSGVRIKTKEGDLFFVMPVAQVDRLQEKIKDREVLIEVAYYPVLERPSSGSGASGYVKRITMEMELIYTTP